MEVAGAEGLPSMENVQLWAIMLSACGRGLLFFH